MLPGDPTGWDVANNRVHPSGVKTTASTRTSCPASSVSALPVLVFHSLTEPSIAPEAKRLPSGE